MICKTMYIDAPDGLCGNDDCGQMSAWYLFSSLGFYPVCPGSTEYALGSPTVVSAEIDLGQGQLFEEVQRLVCTSGARVAARQVVLGRETCRVQLQSAPHGAGETLVVAGLIGFVRLLLMGLRFGDRVLLAESGRSTEQTERGDGQGGCESSVTRHGVAMLARTHAGDTAGARAEDDAEARGALQPTSDVGFSLTRRQTRA